MGRLPANLGEFVEVLTEKLAFCDQIGKRFRGIIKDLDKSRPISGAWNGDMDLGLQWAEQVTDMFGLNYNYEQYDP